MNDQKPTVVVPNEVVQCPHCGGYFPVLKSSGGESVAVQPFPVEVVAPHRTLIHSNKPMNPTTACKKSIEGTMHVRKMPPVFVPHIYCCAGGDGIPPLFRPLPMPSEGDTNGEIPETNNPQPHEAVQNNRADGGFGAPRVHEVGSEDR